MLICCVLLILSYNNCYNCDYVPLSYCVMFASYYRKVLIWNTVLLCQTIVSGPIELKTCHWLYTSISIINQRLPPTESIIFFSMCITDWHVYTVTE